MLGCVVAAAAGGVAYAYSGLYDVSATTPDSALFSWIVHKTSDSSVGARLGVIQVPAGLDQPQKIAAGGHLFLQNCAVCHGGPGLTPTNIYLGMNPQPPDLYRAGRVPASDENFQFIKYGIKMSGMPGFSTTKTDDEIWSLVAFLGTAPGLSAADFAKETGSSVTVGK